jgi:hypothetical protein
MGNLHESRVLLTTLRVDRNIHESHKATSFNLFTFILAHSFVVTFIRRHIQIVLDIHSSSHSYLLGYYQMVPLLAVHHGLEHIVGGRLLATSALGRTLNAVAGADAFREHIFVAWQSRRGFAAQALLR